MSPVVDAERKNPTRGAPFIQVFEYVRTVRTERRLLHPFDWHAGAYRKLVKEPGRREVINVARPNLALAPKVCDTKSMKFEPVCLRQPDHPRGQQLVRKRVRMNRPDALRHGLRL